MEALPGMEVDFRWYCVSGDSFLRIAIVKLFSESKYCQDFISWLERIP
jgi:hypothetical protein